MTNTTEQFTGGRLQSAQFGLYSKDVSFEIEEGHCGNLFTKHGTTQETHRFLDDGMRIFVRDNKHKGIVECLSHRNAWRFDGYPYLYWRFDGYPYQYPLVNLFVLPLFFSSFGYGKKSQKNSLGRHRAWQRDWHLCHFFIYTGNSLHFWDCIRT